VVGYDRLVGLGEEGAIARRQHGPRLDPFCRRLNGTFAVLAHNKLRRLGEPTALATVVGEWTTGFIGTSDREY
jgi:hypothetical protein